MEHKNFTAIVFTGDMKVGMNGFVKYRKQNNIERLKNYINSKYPEWKFINVYDRNTRNKIDMIKRV